ncbi:MAG: hypothetical protein E5Y04_28580 [Mesorhizobium sp.]|nr:MAG: hypothetical protein E5Y04_28580 [Mesorhizobium sp.]
MILKSICLGTIFALSTISGSAWAGALDEPDTMEPFFTDSSRTTLKPMEEFKVVFFAMPAEKQEAVKSSCKRQVQQPYTAFCANVNTLGGQK